MMASTATVPRTEFKVMAGSSADTSTDAGEQFLAELRTSGNGPAAGVEGHGLGASDRSVLVCICACVCLTAAHAHGDRLYLLEQQKIADAQKNKRKAEDDARTCSLWRLLDDLHRSYPDARVAARTAELQSFRSTAMKLQAAQKAALLVPDVVAAIKSAAPATASAKKPVAKATLASPIVTIKPKKRRTDADAADASSSIKRKKQQQATPAASRDAPKTSTASSKPASVTPTAAATARAPSALLLQGYSSSSDDDASA